MCISAYSLISVNLSSVPFSQSQNVLVMVSAWQHKEILRMMLGKALAKSGVAMATRAHTRLFS